MSAERNYTHVQFDETTCPVADCTYGKGGVPQTGTVPGIRRHVKRAHGADVYEKMDKAGKFPPMRTASGPISKQTKAQLLEAAKTRKVKDADKMTQAQLIEALTAK